ncbi:tRNA (32-2'-O)-methyltransferase regulator THADA-like isoform X1 [Rhea pennata]|uniref:tRNA (32-2'-O)-methyltransferase regulator THADA-like isoform X1 n=1 Tax=Rhea pennata TaxID=8795 RepID=UPI002E274DA3
MGAEREAQACAAFYGPGGLCPAALSCVQSLRRFAGSSAKRCRDRSLEEALELARAASEGLGPLGDAAARPLLRCLLAFQAEATGSSSAFQKLEQMVAALAAGREALLSRELAALLDGLLGRAEVLPPGDLQSVCMFIEESSLGRLHWRQNLAPLLRRLAATLAWVLRSPPAGAGRWGYLAVKACLQLFQALPRDVAPLAWSEAERSETLRSVLGLLLQVVTGQAPNKDTRLLAGTALSMLVNTAPRPARGASAARALCRLADQGVEELRFGELTVEATSILEPDGLERLVLTRGLLTCCKTDILSCQLESFTHQACLLLDVLFPAVCTLCKEQKDCQYYCFQVFSLWLQRLQECLPEIWCLKGSRILAEDSDLLGQLTQLVWSNAETPVEGVSEFIHSSFRLLLEIYCLECRHFEDQERPLYRQMLQRVISMPWQAKARYVPLCAIVPYVGSEQVLDAYRDLPQHLLSCLATNRLCPAAAEVYKAVVQQQRTEWLRGPRGPEEALAERWALHWLPLLSQALRSPVPILQSNAANHLLPWTLRLLPASYAPLAAEFGGRDAAALRAWVALLRAHKSITGTLAAEGETRERLSRCLHAGEEGVRLAALELLCCSPSTSRALSGTEVRLLREFLPLNLNGDSSAFRQLLQAAVKKALVRLRDSSLARLRGRAPRGAEPGAGAEPLAQAVSFVEWLLQLSVSSLTPGSNYQRKKTALLLLAVVLETCTDTWSPERRKGQPPKTMAVLLSYARHQGCWDFFSQPNLLALLSCLQDSTNEIRDLASELLVRYFPAPLPEPVALALFQLAQEALSSPRVQEAEAGAVLMETILQKSDSSTLRSLSLEAGAAPTPQPRGLCFAQHLLRVLQAQYAAARQDLLQAAATKPMHGVIAALRRCLLQVPEVAVSMRAAEWAQSWQEFLTSLVATARDITSFLLGALQSGQGPSSDQQATAPSFADMGNAIGSLIMLGKGQGQREDDSVLLSEEHSLILTCCWVSVKEIGLLLGGLAELLLSPAPAGPASPLPLASLQTAAEVFREILLRCRHWGAVEGCSVGFTKFCAALLNHAEAELRAIPPAMLAQGLEALSGPRSSSITRRAAGFPMLFLCIVSAEAPAPARPLLARCIEALLALAASALPRDWDQTLDLPQACALHALQALVRGAGLGSALLPHAAPMMALALRGLGSPSWAVRNAAIQLFSALAARLLGQKRSRAESRRGDGDGDGDGVSLQAFLGQHPRLGALLLGELAAAAPGGPPLRPALQPVLTLLAQLQPGADDPGSASAPFVAPLLRLAASPLYAVRATAAKALAALVPPPRRRRLLLRLARQLPAPGRARSHNALHGRLLQLRALLEPDAHDRAAAEALRPVARRLEARAWLLTPAQRCPLVRAAFLQALAPLAASCSPGFAARLRLTLAAELRSREPGPAALQVGSAVLHQTIACFLCSEAARLADEESISSACSLLQEPNADVQFALLSWVIKEEGGKCDALEKALRITLLENLQSVLQDRRNKEFLKLYLEALMHLCRNLTSWSEDASSKFQGSSSTCMEILLLMMETEEPGPDLLFQALYATSLLLTLRSGDEAQLLVERWCVILEKCSKCVSSEVLRLAAARSLQLAGVDVVQRCQGAACPSLVPVALRLINVGIHLLQDEEQEVRHEASNFASLVHRVPGEQVRDGYIFVQANTGLLGLLQLLLEKFGDHPETFSSLLQHLPLMDLRGILEELKANKASSLYKEDEPNVFAEPAVLSQLLLPFLLQLLEKASVSCPLRESALCWLEATGPSILRDLQYCKHQWSQEAAGPWWMKALGCAKLHTAVAVLLARAKLLVRALEVVHGSTATAPGLGCSAHELQQELALVQGLLARHGLAPGPGWGDGLREPGPPSGAA